MYGSPTDLLSSAQVAVNKQESSFQNWAVSRTEKKHSTVVKYKVRQIPKEQVDTHMVLLQTNFTGQCLKPRTRASRYTHGVTANQLHRPMSETPYKIIFIYLFILNL